MSFHLFIFYVVSLTTDVATNKIIANMFVNLSGDNKNPMVSLTKNPDSWGEQYLHARDVEARISEVIDHVVLNSS